MLEVQRYIWLHSLFRQYNVPQINIANTAMGIIHSSFLLNCKYYRGNAYLYCTAILIWASGISYQGLDSFLVNSWGFMATDAWRELKRESHIYHLQWWCLPPLPQHCCCADGGELKKQPPPYRLTWNLVILQYMYITFIFWRNFICNFKLKRTIFSKC